MLTKLCKWTEFFSHFTRPLTVSGDEMRESSKFLFGFITVVYTTNPADLRPFLSLWCDERTETRLSKNLDERETGMTGT